MASTNIPSFVELNDLACKKVGGEILFATDDWFAVAENLLQDNDPVWWEGEFTLFGKRMDGWETRRKRIPGHDWCIIKLGIPGVIHGFDVNTRFFTGNFTPRMSIQAACLESDEDFPQRSSEMGSKASEEELEEMKKLHTEDWEELVSMQPLRAGIPETCHNYFRVNSAKRWTHLRLNMFPDGGIARLRVYGEAQPRWEGIRPNELVDLVAIENGGVCVGYSNAHFCHPRNLITKARSVTMADGWETARKLDRPAVLELGENGVLKYTGCDWCVFRLGTRGIIEKIEVDTNHFKGNFPDSCTIEGCVLTLEEEQRARAPHPERPHGDFDAFQWKAILPIAKLSAHKRHFFKGSAVTVVGPVTHIRLTLRPDGGISRLRLWGHKAANANL
ncbi:allantoicase-like [Diadema antillarum]|uniref:allantoicase-like n=1 Tax=Diadema antillarum TaxID=105358 RepID=UPI003A85E697